VAVWVWDLAVGALVEDVAVGIVVRNHLGKMEVWEKYNTGRSRTSQASSRIEKVKSSEGNVKSKDTHTQSRHLI